MTFIPPQGNIWCDCLQPGCSYCDQDGSRTKARDEFWKKALERLELEKDMPKPAPVQVPEKPESFFQEMLEKIKKKIFGK